MTRAMPAHADVPDDLPARTEALAEADTDLDRLIAHARSQLQRGHAPDLVAAQMVQGLLNAPQWWMSPVVLCSVIGAAVRRLA